MKIYKNEKRESTIVILAPYMQLCVNCTYYTYIMVYDHDLFEVNLVIACHMIEVPSMY